MHCKATKVLGSRMQHGNANEMLGLSDAMKTTRSPQRRARRKGNKMLDGRMRRRQRAARSSVRTAEQRRSRCAHDIHFEWQTPYLLRCVGDACSIYFAGNICASCLCVSAHYTTKFVSPRSISSSNIILRNSFHQEVYLAATLISLVRVAV